MEKYQKLPYIYFLVPTLLFSIPVQVKDLYSCKKPTALTTCLMCVFFTRLIRLLSIEGLMKSEAIVLVSVLPLTFSG